MRNKLYIYLGSIIFITLIFSISLPSFLAKFDELYLLGTHELKKMDLNLDSEAKDIPLVQRIYDIYDGIYSADESEIASVVQIMATSDEQKIILEQLKELIEKKVLVNNDDYITDKVESVYVKMIYSAIVQNLKEYVINFRDQQISLWWDIESNKIISIKIIGNGQIRVNDNKEDILRGYSSYLNLDLLGDWVIESDVIQSNKSSLIIKADILNNKIEQYLSIIPKLAQIQ